MLRSESYQRILHKMGYYEYQHGLIFRHLSQEEGWNRHLEKCRDFILKAAERVRPKKVTVLGSGWLLEVPVLELSEKVEKVILVDIVHPPEVRKQTVEMKNIEVSEQDVSGGLIKEVWDKGGRFNFLSKMRSLDDIKIPQYRFHGDPGMVVSVNILTQLEILPERFLKRHTRVSEEEYLKFRTEVQRNHIKSLGGYRAVIITDTSETITEKNGSVTEKKTLLAELPKGSYSESWTWDFDLRSQDYNMQKSVLSVTAIII